MADRPHGTAIGGEHAGHDPELVAALLDPDASDGERAVAEAMVATCRGCADLRDDLVALSAATRTQPAPTRTRDFRLTAADAARLGAQGGEPRVAGTRLTDDMTDPRTVSAHATHDTILVASLADRSLDDKDRAAAEALVARCGLCAALHADLIALRAATQAMPTPPRPRDYRLTDADAARLRPAGWRRWVAAIGSSRDAFSRPLAIGLTTLGLAGLVVAGLPSLSMGSATSAPPPAAESVQDLSSGAARPTIAAPGFAAGGAAASGGEHPNPVAAASAAAAPVAPVASVGAAPDRATTGSPEILGDSSTNAGAKASGFDAGTGQTNPVEAIGTNGLQSVVSGGLSLQLVSLVLLVAGLGLFLLRWTARRFGA